MILDNAPAGLQDAARTFTGSWCASSATNSFGTDSLYSCSDSGTDTYRWTPDLTAAGTYDVYIWWSTTQNRSTKVPVSVVHANGTTTLSFNERVGGGQWVLHGRYTFNAGTGGYVQTSGTPSQQAAADAVKFVAVTTGTDNPVPVASGLSPASATAGGPAFTLTVTGSNFITSSVVRWNGSDRATTYVSGTQLRAAIGAGDIATAGTATVTVFTPSPGGGLSGGLTFTIAATAPAGEVIVDNAAAGVQDAARTFTGSWCTSGATNFFGTDSLFSCSSSGTDTYRWTPTLAAGTYDVFIWWSTNPNRGTAVPVSVVHANGTSTAVYNEQIGGGQWVLHGRYTFNAGTGGYVQTSGTSSQQAAADAVRFVPATAGHPRFSGPYESPFICMTQQAGLGPALDVNCSAPTITTWVYLSTSGTFKPLADPTQRPTDLSQAVVDGRPVPFIVRVEKGTINRSIYEIARLDDPAGWNGRLIYVFGGGCEGGWYIQGSATAGVLNSVMLGRGYATASASLNVFGTNCNDVLAAETMMMVKDRFEAQIGPPAFTIGWGCSGGSYQAHQISDNYPGLLDGIIVGCSFPDVTSATILTVTDASLLQRYFGRSTLAWTSDQKRAVSGFAQAAAIDTLAPSAARIDPDANCDASIPPEWRYNATTNPAGARCDVYDHTVNVYGRDPVTGFARRPLDNVGVQYGLGALNAGSITKQQFLDLNEKIGGFDNDGNFVSARTVGDENALQTAHATGRVLYAGAGLAGTPIIDYRAYSDLSAGGDVHMKIHSFSTRERLRQTTGQTANHVMLLEDGRYGSFSLTSPVLAEALADMDDWLVTLLSDQSNDPPAVKVARSKPGSLVDACYDSSGNKIAEPATIQGGACNTLYPTFSTPRLVAGAPVVDNALKCSLKALTPGDYAVTFSSTEWTRLQQIFPDGVCDYSRAGNWQVPLQGTWLSY